MSARDAGSGRVRGLRRFLVRHVHLAGLVGNLVGRGLVRLAVLGRWLRSLGLGRDGRRRLDGRCGRLGEGVAESESSDTSSFKNDFCEHIGLPRLNGFDAARRMRERPGGNDMVLVALTGWGAEEDRRRSHEAGFDHHMVKPVDPAALEKLLAGLGPPRRRA